MRAAHASHNIAHHVLKPVVGVAQTKTAIIDLPHANQQAPWRHTSFSALRERTLRFAAGLQQLDFPPGSRLVLAMPDGLDCATALLGTLAAGYTAVMCNPANIHDVAARARDISAQLIIGNPDHGWRAPNSLLQSSPLSDAVAVTPETDALWLYSGGTTGGKQKVVRQSHGSYTSVTTYLGIHLGYNAKTVSLSVPRLFFGYATGMNLFFPLAAGGTAVLDPYWPSASRLFHLAQQHQPNIMANTPAMIVKMLDWIEQNPDSNALANLAYMTSAGEKLPRSVYERWVAHFPNVSLCDALGFAEHWHLLSMNGPENIVPGTVGPIIPPQRAEIRSESGAVLPDGETGYLHVTGPALANGYFNNPTATEVAFIDGWFRPGDLAHFEVGPDGIRRLVYDGRSGSHVKISGQWVSTDAVADCILQLDAVHEAAVLAFEDPRSSLTQLAAFVSIHPGHPEFTKQTVVQQIGQHMKPYKRPRRIFLYDAETGLPRTALGKIDRSALAKRLQQDGAKHPEK